MNTIEGIRKKLKSKSNPKRAKIYSRYFKSGSGEYGEGDIFLGVSIPDLRTVARQYINLPLSQIETLLHSRIHEERLLAVIIIVDSFARGDYAEKERIYRFYLKNVKWINNWDLVDLSAPKIIGCYLLGKSKVILYNYAKSKNLWKRRIAIIATFEFIRHANYNETIKIAEILLSDQHNLIHKAVGWMLREVGKRSIQTEELFLKKYYKFMPRVMLRYSIEKFSDHKKQLFLQKDYFKTAR